MLMHELSADYVIIGSGSAGSVLANRLSANGKHKVLVLEYGGTDRGPLIQMPSALSYPMNMPSYDWGYISDPEPHLDGRQLACPRGKVIGGSSSINGMVYVRGHACDFDTWEKLGAKGWGFRHVQPYFQRMETSHGGEEGWRGHDGPMHVTRGIRKNPLYHAFEAAAHEAGYPLTNDYNGRQQEGFGAMEMTVWQGNRWSAANAYLKPALKRPNLHLHSRVYVRRIIIKNRRATGVEFEQGGMVKIAHAHAEVILAASAINSPKILQLSGIGDGNTLQAAEVPVAVNLPGVGANLQDHLEIYLQMHCKQAITLNSHLSFFSKARIGLEWLLFKRGLGATNHFESCGFIRSAAGVKYPDLQYHFLPAAIRYDGKLAVQGHGFQMHIGPMRSPSRGRVKIRSNNYHQAPSIRFNYMEHDEDWHNFRTAIRLTREIMDQPAMADFAGPEIQPGTALNTDDELNDFIRHHVESAYHPCGTCKMGNRDDPLAVVDHETRVIGVDGLRVADSSIFPQITNGNLNGPSLMTGEKAADHILGHTPLPASNDEPWINPNWKTAQR